MRLTPRRLYRFLVKMVDLNFNKDAYKAFIFDCDGTLAESMEVHFKSWCQAFAMHGAKFDFSWDLFRSMGGMGLVQSVELMNDKFNDTMNPQQVVDEQAKLVDDLVHHIKPNHEIVALAHELSGVYPISVASGGHRKHVHETLKAIGVDDVFSIVVTRDDVEHSKPAPDLFLLAAEKMGIEPQDCLVFEDSMPGIQAAMNAGMDYVLVREH